MAKIAIVKKSDYSIGSFYEGPADQSKYGGPWGDSSQFSHVEVPAELDHMLCKAQSDGQGGIEIVLDQDKEDAAIDAAWDKLRADRNHKLLLCDYTQLADADLTQVQKDAFATYRQELRDLPENTVDPRNPDWPQEPQQ